MPKRKVCYILPLLAVVASATCIGAAELSEKAASTLKPQKEKNLYPGPVDQMDEGCLGLTLLDFEIALDKKHEDLFRHVTAKGQELHGLTKQYLVNIRSKWKACKEELCSDPTATINLKTPSSRILYLCDVQQTRYHLKALKRF